MIVRRATVHLAIRYSLVMLGVIALFALGVALYVSVAFDIELPEASASEEAIDRANSTLHTGLAICFAVLVLLVPLLSYLLARSALAPVRASLEAQQRFVDDASHELRTPIAIAQGELELSLMQPRTAEEYRDTIRGALEAVEELSGLTNDLLLLTRSDQLGGDAPLVPLEELSERALLALPPETRDRVATQVAPGGSLQCVPELLTRAITNLLENAAKFSPPETPISLSMEQVDGATRIAIVDLGPGMNPADTARAFERFWRADASRSTSGHGIGLSIVQRIAEYHGGSVALQSSPGKGTRAILDLPHSDRHES